MITFEFEEVGTVGQSHGLEGGLRFSGSDRALEACLQSGWVFVRMVDGSPVPFRIVYAEDKRGVILYFEGVGDPQEAKALTGRPILLLSDQVREVENAAEKEVGDPGSWVGYEVHDRQSGRRLLIQKIEEYPQQMMAVVEGQQLIPLHPEMIERIDHDEKLIEMDLPEGLLED